jgi:hypothetical protein
MTPINSSLNESIEHLSKLLGSNYLATLLTITVDC